MPTAYTQPLYDNEPITFEQFVLRCAHAMGAAAMQSDEGLDTPIRPRTVNDTYVQHVKNAVTALAEAFERADEEWAQLQSTEIEKARLFHHDYLARKKGVYRRYRDMASLVKAWKPPTAEHDDLKTFMLEQIRTAQVFDVSSYEPEIPAAVDVAEYREREIGRLSRELEQRTKYLQEERQRVRDQNAWLTALHASLGTTEA